MRFSFIGFIGLLLFSTACVEKEPTFQIEEVPICYKDYGFHLGMNFDTAKAKLTELLPNQKGPNINSESIFDFYSLSEKTNSMLQILLRSSK